mmetsp:Transcript_85540/g.205016  ORF Transcript_85540/g.205016 Transcript_85540/m.205016 type:complete len:205 (-) Transcript_85540:417-1031(-)
MWCRQRQTVSWWMCIGLALPSIGIPKHFSKTLVVPPKKSRKKTMIRIVAFRRVSLVPGEPSSTHGSSSSVRTKAIPPRKPACHIMKIFFQFNLRLFSQLSEWPATDLQPLVSSASGNTAAALPRRQKAMTRLPNTRPLRSQYTAVMPTKRKTTMSARVAACFSAKAQNMVASAENCSLAKALANMEANSTVIIPDIEHTRSAKQ